MGGKLQLAKSHPHVDFVTCAACWQAAQTPVPRMKLGAGPRSVPARAIGDLETLCFQNLRRPQDGCRYEKAPLPLPGSRQWSNPLAFHVAVQHMGLELLTNECSAVAARAHQTDASAGKRLERRDTDLCREAARHDNAFVEAEVDDPAHRRRLNGSSLQA